MPTLSSILVQRGAASMRAVEEAIARQVLHGGDLPTNLLELGAVSEQVLTAVLGESFGLLPAPAGKLLSPPERVLRVISGELAVRHGVFPLDLRDRALVLATAEPLSNVVEDDLGFALDVTIQQLAAPLVRVRQAIAEHYGIPLDRRLLRLVAKLDGRTDPSPSTMPPPGRDLFPLKPRPLSVPVPSFGTGVPSSATREANEEISTIAFAPLPKIPQSARVPQGIEDVTPSPRPSELMPGSVTVSRPVLVQSASSDLHPPSSRGPTTMPLPFLEHQSAPATVPVLAWPAANPLPAPAEASAAPEPLSAPLEAAAAPEPLPPPAEAGAKSDPRGTRALVGWVRHERRSSAATMIVGAEASPSWRAPRRKGPFSAEAAEKELSAATTTDAVLEIFFTFALQFFEFAALFVIQGDIAEGRAVSGAGAARTRIAGIGVPLDLPSSLSRARERRGPLIGPLSTHGLDADLARDLERGPRTAPVAVALIPVVVRSRAVAILYGDDGESDVALSALGDVIAFTTLVSTALERLALRKKLGTRAGERAPGLPPQVPASSGALPAGFARPPAKRDAGAPRASGIAALAKALTEEGAEPGPEETSKAPASQGAAVGTSTPEDEPTFDDEALLEAELAASTSPGTARNAEEPASAEPRSTSKEPAATERRSASVVSSRRDEARESEDAPATLREQVEEVGPEVLASASQEFRALAGGAPSSRAARSRRLSSEPPPEIEVMEPSVRGSGPREEAATEPLPPPRTPYAEARAASALSSSVTIPELTSSAAAWDAPPDSPTPILYRATGRAVQGEPAPASSPASESGGAPPSSSSSARDQESSTALDTEDAGFPRGGVARPGQRGQAPHYAGRSRAEGSTLEPLSRTPLPSANAWTSFPSPPPPVLPVRPPLSDHPIPREDDAAPGSAPLPPSGEMEPSAPLPSVIVDVSAEYASLLARVIEGGQGSHEAFNELVRNGEQVLQALMARFPGPLRVDRHRARAELPAASQCGPILEIIVAIRRPSLPFVSVRSSSPDVEIRFWATHVLGELRYPEAANVLVPRIFDDDASVRRIARRSAAALVSAGVAGAPILQGLDNITRSPDHPAPHRVLAIETMGEIRIGAMIPPLIAVLGDASEDVGDAARRALLMITRQDFGRDAKRWQEWWIRNASRHRIEWLMDALMHEQPSLRRAAGDELKLLTKEYFGYYDDLPKKERERAQSLYREWWEREGRSRFS